MTSAERHFTAFDRTAPTAYARTVPTCLPTQARPFAPALKRRPSTRTCAPAAAIALPASSKDDDRVAVASRSLESQRRRATRVGEGGVVPQHLVAVLERHLVGADRRRDAVHLEHPARRAGARDTGRSGSRTARTTPASPGRRTRRACSPASSATSGFGASTLTGTDPKIDWVLPSTRTVTVAPRAVAASTRARPRTATRTSERRATNPPSTRGSVWRRRQVF